MGTVVVWHATHTRILEGGGQCDPICIRIEFKSVLYRTRNNCILLKFAGYNVVSFVTS